MKAAIADHACPGDLLRPGHVFPLRARRGGVLERAGHTEANVDLMRLAGLKPYGVLCELMNPDGTMARMPQIVAFAKQHNMVMVSVEDIIWYRKSSADKGRDYKWPVSHALEQVSKGPDGDAGGCPAKRRAHLGSCSFLPCPSCPDSSHREAPPPTGHVFISSLNQRCSGSD